MAATPQGFRLSPRKREVREADLSPGRTGRRARLDQFPDPSPPPWELADDSGPRPRVLIGFTGTWTAEVVAYRPGRTCPGCGDARLRSHEHCVVCSTEPRQPRRWPMMDARLRTQIQEGPLRPRVRRARTRRERRQLVGAGQGAAG
jgi:hypothetical protein